MLGRPVGRRRRRRRLPAGVHRLVRPRRSPEHDDEEREEDAESEGGAASALGALGALTMAGGRGGGGRRGGDERELIVEGHRCVYDETEMGGRGGGRGRRSGKWRFDNVCFDSKRGPEKKPHVNLHTFFMEIVNKPVGYDSSAFSRTHALHAF